MKFAYCPEWYSLKIIKRWKMAYRISLIVFVTGIFVMLIYVNVQYGRLTISEERVKVKNEESITENEELFEESNDNLNFFYEFCDLKNKNNINFKSVVMEDNIISADIYLNKREDYSEAIRILEDKYKVVESSSIEEVDGRLFFKVKVDGDVS